MEKFPKLIVSCTVLHNIYKHLKDRWAIEEPLENDYEENNDKDCANLDRNSLRIWQERHQKRADIM